MSACPDCGGRGASTIDSAGNRVYYCNCGPSFEIALKASLVDAQIRELEKSFREVRAVLKEAATELQRLSSENDTLSTDNKIMRERLKIVELRRNRADVGHLPLRAVE